jgi:hypothetical protein
MQWSYAFAAHIGLERAESFRERETSEPEPNVSVADTK